jgi:signal transduction histidine kinase
VNSTRQLRELQGQATAGQCQVDLSGVVTYVSRKHGCIVLQDQQGAARIHLNPDRHTVSVGDQIRLEGFCNFWQGRVVADNVPLINHDGLHSASERSARAYLSAGRTRVRVTYFERTGDEALQLSYQGPGLQKQPVPAGSLLCSKGTSATDPDEFQPGLNYQYYEGSWSETPDYSLLTPLKQGVAPNLDLGLRGRDDDFGFQFSGYIELPRAGWYTFFLTSDDGSQLYLNEFPARLTVTGQDQMPTPIKLTLGQAMREEDQHRWAEVEGAVGFVAEHLGALQLELEGGGQRLQVEIANLALDQMPNLLHSRVRVWGTVQAVDTLSDRRLAGRLETVGRGMIHLLEIAPAVWGSAPITTISNVVQTSASGTSQSWHHLQGLLAAGSESSGWKFTDETGTITVLLLEGRHPAAGTQVHLLGRVRSMGDETVVYDAFHQQFIEQGTEEKSDKLPVLTTLDQVQGVSSAEAARQYPVKIRCVMTFVDRYSFVQDETRGICLQGWGSERAPEFGGYYEIEGVTDPGGYAPMLVPRKVTYLGPGQLPEPGRPSWDQLVSGSQDSQYIEIRGVVTAVRDNTLEVAVQGGRVPVQVHNADPASLVTLVDAIVRARGCCSTEYNQKRQFTGVILHLHSAAFLSVDEPAPADPFILPAQSIEQLTRFNTQGGVVRRAKVMGVITHRRQDAFFLTDGTNSMRFFPRFKADLSVGDRVELVGFSDKGYSSAVLREVTTLKRGTRQVPSPAIATPIKLLTGELDAARVCLEAALIKMTTNKTEFVLELLGDDYRFLARLESYHGELPPLRPGSVLKLTGTCAGQSAGGRPGDRLDSFELWLNSPEDVVVLASPPRWGFRDALLLAGFLAVLVVLAMVWISMLRRRVDRRTAELKQEVDHHKTTLARLAAEMEERKRVEERVEKANKQLVDASRKSGMAEIATGVLHNVGNVLNSVNVSVNLLTEKIKHSRSSGLAKLVELFDQHANNLAGFLTEHAAGRQVPEYLRKLNEHIKIEQQEHLSELDTLGRNVDHIKQIVVMQQGYAKHAGVYDRMSPIDVIEDALKIHSGAFLRHDVKVIKEYGVVPPFLIDKHKVLQILVNLLSNAKYACDEGGQAEKRITVRVRMNGSNMVRIEAEDNGVGIPPENINRIFTHGFTTKKKGHGFGLHSCALAAREMGGNLVARSEGSGRGACFTLEIPIKV